MDANVNEKNEENFVAFLDILGFREMVAKNCDKKRIQKIFETVTNWGSILNVEAPSEIVSDESCKNTELERLSYYLMSDSIVVNIKSDAGYALIKLIEACRKLQCELFNLEPPVLIRGAIAKGEYYTDERIAFGKAMVDAYTYQENYSRYPRVIISKKLVEEERQRKNLSDEDIFHLLQLDREDQYYYIDSLKYYINRQKEYFLKNDSEWHKFVRFHDFIEKQTLNYGPLSVREKYIWVLKEYKRITDDSVMPKRESSVWDWLRYN